VSNVAYTSNKSRWLLILAYGVALAMSSGMHDHVDCHGSDEEARQAEACGAGGTHLDSQAPEQGGTDASNCVACHFLSQPVIDQADGHVIETPSRAYSDSALEPTRPVALPDLPPARGPPTA
jgi:hypothetical protein